MNKKLIRLTESDLHRIVRESVNKVLKERVIQIGDDEYEEGKMKQNVPNANGISYYNGRAIDLS